MARRHLNFTIDEWDELPWTHRRIYLEGLVEEFVGQEEQYDEEYPPARTIRVLDLDEDGDEAFAEFGIRPQAV